MRPDRLLDIGGRRVEATTLVTEWPEHAVRQPAGGDEDADSRRPLHHAEHAAPGEPALQPPGGIAPCRAGHAF